MRKIPKVRSVFSVTLCRVWCTHDLWTKPSGISSLFILLILQVKLPPLPPPPLPAEGLLGVPAALPLMQCESKSKPIRPSHVRPGGG
jgi:hypothetical protein